MSRILGNENASAEEVGEIVDILKGLGSIEYTRALADRYVREAKEQIETIPGSRYKDLLLAWAEYMIRREF
jgi:geranylgeranyl diphosphate synthase type I